MRIATARPSGMEWLTAMNSQSNGPSVLPLALAHLDGHGGDPVLLELGRDEGQRQPGADHGDVGPLACSRYGTPPMWSSCPCVSTMRVDLVQAVPDPGEVRAGSRPRPAGAPRGTAPRSRRPAAGRRARTPSCSGRSHPGRPAARSAGRPSAAPAASRTGQSRAVTRGGSSGHPRSRRGAGRTAVGMLSCAHCSPSVVSVVAPGRVWSSAIMPGAGTPAGRRDRCPSRAGYPKGYRDLWP